ncbi:hypothetical protein H5410_047177 [Solanum commersonii]|uniref:DUF4283 domain-containing protein n=1 Tax=Solanum commersonii TaxID=4109 RepID=A0A9J5XGH6_SOLCO|nr:hypothetical protein H5410_047177 [Solanum commersonii]
MILNASSQFSAPTTINKPMSFINSLIKPVPMVNQKPDMEIDAEDTIFVGNPTQNQTTDNSNAQESYKEDHITLSTEEKIKIQKPLPFSIIIKLLGRKMSHDYLKKKISILWRLSEEIILIDLGSDYYIVKFLKEENMRLTLQNGPWFINGFFLSIKKWHPNFIASEADETYSAIWIRLPELPTEYYDHTVLVRIGSKLGRLVKQNTPNGDLANNPSRSAPHAKSGNRIDMSNDDGVVAPLPKHSSSNFRETDHPCVREPTPTPDPSIVLAGDGSPRSNHDLQCTVGQLGGNNLSPKPYHTSPGGVGWDENGDGNIQQSILNDDPPHSWKPRFSTQSLGTSRTWTPSTTTGRYKGRHWASLSGATGNKNAKPPTLTRRFSLNQMIKVSTMCNSDGLVLLWDDNILELDEIATKGLEIHAMIKCTSWDLGSGNLISFWEDRLLPHPLLRKRILGPLHKQDLALKVSDVILNGIWALHNLSIKLPLEIHSEINSMNIPQGTKTQDKLTWALTNNKTFTTKSAYNFLKNHKPNTGLNHSNVPPTPTHVAFNWIWQLKCPNKIKELLWRMKEPTIQHEPREGNKVAVLLAHHGRNLPGTVLFEAWHNAPSFVLDVVDKDKDVSSSVKQKALLCNIVSVSSNAKYMTQTGASNNNTTTDCIMLL